MLKIVMGLLEEGKVEERKERGREERGRQERGREEGGERREERGERSEEERSILQYPFDPTSERRIYLFIHSVCIHPFYLYLKEGVASVELKHDAANAP